MKWILIWTAISNIFGGWNVATSSVEFDSQAACEAAAKDLNANQMRTSNPNSEPRGGFIARCYSKG